MDEKALSLKQALRASRAAEPRGDTERLQNDIERLRLHLGGLVSELDRRRREFFDVRRQVDRHPVAFIVGAVALAGAVGGGVALVVARRRRHRRERQRALPRLLRLWRLSEDPGAPASSPRAPIIAAVTRVAAAALLRRLGRRRRYD